MPEDSKNQVDFDPAGGWVRAMGLEYVKLDPDEIVAELEVGEQHKQPFGLVHGGVHCGLVETVCSVGASLHARRSGQNVVGVENHTSFVRAARDGRLRVTGKPVHSGRRAHLWEATIVDGEGRLIATGRVRLLSVDVPPAK